MIRIAFQQATEGDATHGILQGLLLKHKFDSLVGSSENVIVEDYSESFGYGFWMCSMFLASKLVDSYEAKPFVLGETSLLMNTTASLPFRRYDPNGEVLSISIIEQPTNGTLDGNFPEISYTPNPDFHGIDTFTFLAHRNDNSLRSDTNLYTINVLDTNPNNINDSAPQPESTEDTVLMNETVQYKFRAINPTGTKYNKGEINFVVVQAPVNGTLKRRPAGRFNYTPNKDFVGQDSVIFMPYTKCFAGHKGTKIFNVIDPNSDR